MHKQGPPGFPLSVTVEFVMLESLIRGALAILNPYPTATWEGIRQDIRDNEALGDSVMLSGVSYVGRINAQHC